MGYRTYIGSIPKREYNKIKSMTSSQLIEHYKINLDTYGSWHKGVYEICKEVYEFGKYTDFNPPKSSMKSFFKNKELKEKYKEDDFYVVTKEFLEYIIETYKIKITDYYNKMMMPFFKDTNKEYLKEYYSESASDFLKTIKRTYKEDYLKNELESYECDFSKLTQEQTSALISIFYHVKNFRTEWTILCPFDLKNGDQVSTSWKFEYSIFELVKIYKTFDFKRNVLVFYGY